MFTLVNWEWLLVNRQQSVVTGSSFMDTERSAGHIFDRNNKRSAIATKMDAPFSTLINHTSTQQSEQSTPKIVSQPFITYKRYKIRWYRRHNLTIQFGPLQHFFENPSWALKFHACVIRAYGIKLEANGLRGNLLLWTLVGLVNLQTQPFGRCVAPGIPGIRRSEPVSRTRSISRLWR